MNWGEWFLERDAFSFNDASKKLLSMVGAKLAELHPRMGLDGFISQLEPVGRDFALAEQDAVRFMTMGKSKGLTFNTAIVLGVEDGLVPMPPPKGDADEERRLLYVAMTRATDRCILTMARRRNGPVGYGGAPNQGNRGRCSLLEGIADPSPSREFMNALDEIL